MLLISPAGVLHKPPDLYSLSFPVVWPWYYVSWKSCRLLVVLTRSCIVLRAVVRGDTVPAVWCFESKGNRYALTLLFIPSSSSDLRWQYNNVYIECVPTGKWGCTEKKFRVLFHWFTVYYSYMFVFSEKKVAKSFACEWESCTFASASVIEAVKMKCRMSGRESYFPKDFVKGSAVSLVFLIFAFSVSLAGERWIFDVICINKQDVVQVSHRIFIRVRAIRRKAVNDFEYGVLVR